MNQSIENTMQKVLQKYSEMIKGEMGNYYQKLIAVMKEPGLSLPPPPNTNLAQVFGQKCAQDLVAIFEKKLDRFPKYALEKSAMFGTKLEPITMELADSDSIQKQSLCQNLSRLYASFIQLIQESVVGLVTCRASMDGMMVRLNQSFQGPNGQSGPIAESKANLVWFQKMKELQSSYTKQLKAVDKFLKKMDGITLLSDKQLNKLIADMQKLVTSSQSLPQTCSALASELQTIQTVDVRQAAECNRLKIAEKDCSANTIDTAIKKLEQQQRTAARQLAQRRVNLAGPTSALNQAAVNAQRQAQAQQQGRGRKYKK
jgi:hypothetical protein